MSFDSSNSEIADRMYPCDDASRPVDELHTSKPAILSKSTVENREPKSLPVQNLNEMPRLNVLQENSPEESIEQIRRLSRTNYLDKRSSMKSGSGINKDSKKSSVKSTSPSKLRHGSKFIKSQKCRSKQVISRLSSL